MVYFTPTNSIARSVDITSNGEYIVIGDTDDYVRLFDKDDNSLWSYQTDGDVNSV